MSATFDQTFQANKDRFVSEWTELLEFPSIGADPERDKDCSNCAEWLRRHLTNLGLKSWIQETSGKPLVMAERKGKEGKPTVLIYGHYDVQPVDPIEDWTTPPFEPEVRDGRLYARGAEDNKGQIFYVVKALEALIEHDALDCTVKILFEGEEECGGSQGITEFIKTGTDDLKADILMVTDVCRVTSNEPTIIMGLRGIISLGITLKGADYDLHSGMHGGIAPNPATGIARLITSLHREDGSIAVEGFEDDARAVSEKETELAATTTFDAANYAAMIGVAPVAGEKAFTPVERVGFRPTVEVNGVHSGYGGPGGKTIIPSEASAKISCRLVAGQEPETVLELVCKHLTKHAPEGLVMEISDKVIGGHALRVDSETEPVHIATQALAKVTGQKPVFYYEGASIPIIPSLSAAAGADPVLVGFGSDEGRAHAPNESFAIDDFRLGFLYACEFLSSL